MATVSAGSTASYTLTAADSISITIDSGTESANVRVTNGSTAPIYSEVINRSKIIGPFPSGAVMSITAIGGDVVYEQVDQEGARDFTQTEKTSLQALAAEYGNGTLVRAGLPFDTVVLSATTAAIRSAPCQVAGLVCQTSSSLNINLYANSANNGTISASAGVVLRDAWATAL